MHFHKKIFIDFDPNWLVTTATATTAAVSADDDTITTTITAATTTSITLCRELVCITVNWTWYNGRDKFFYITSGRIYMWKGVNQLKELFCLYLIIFLFEYTFKIDK